MSDTEMIIRALATFARAARTEARGHVYSGPQFKDRRIDLRAEAAQAEQLAEDLKTRRKIIV